MHGQPLGRLFSLPYGETHQDLPGFLGRLVPEPQARQEEGRSPKPVVRIPALLPANIAHYLTCLVGETATLRLLGMGRSLQIELPIDEAYVPLRTVLARSLQLHETERFGRARRTRRNVDLGDVFRKAAALELHGVVLLGEPGSGKTTGARQLAWRLASRTSLPEDVGLPAGVTPVFLRFRNLSRGNCSGRTSGLREFLVAETLL
jgi:hypothetical protein